MLRFAGRDAEKRGVEQFYTREEALDGDVGGVGDEL
jgi:hypothetical protein